MTDYDAIVVGAGAVGIATARHLTEAGNSVLVLDRHPVPNERGASHGRSRIIRLAYHEGEKYVPLLRRALADWRHLEDSSNEKLVYSTGALSIGAPESDAFSGALATCKSRDIEYEVLTASEVNERFHGYDIDDGHRAVWQPEAGMLDSHRCRVVQLRTAMQSGAEIHGNEAVTDWTSDDGVRVATERSEYTAESLVVATGGWAAEEVDTVNDLLTVERHLVGRFQTTNPERFQPWRFPVFVMDEKGGGHYYGLPSFQLPEIKVGATHVGREGVNAEHMNRTPRSADINVTTDFVNRSLSGQTLKPTSVTACPLTHTPDGDYIVDQHPTDDGVFLGVGMSGHGFKLSNVVGEMLANMVTGDGGDRPDWLGLGRFD